MKILKALLKLANTRKSKELEEMKKIEEIREKRLLDLKEKHYNYVKIVDSVIEKNLNSVDNNLKEKYNVKLVQDLNYLRIFEKHFANISKNYIIGLPDTFIEASCLMFALIDCKQISFKLQSNESTELFKINYQIAFDVALILISCPTVYDLDEKMGKNYLSIKYDCIDIHIPKGLISNDTFFDRFVNSIALNDLYNESCSILSYANFFYLLYLYNVK